MNAQQTVRPSRACKWQRLTRKPLLDTISYNGRATELRATRKKQKEKGEVGTAYGVYDEDAGVENRGRFSIDPDGVIQAFEVLTPPVGRSVTYALWRNDYGPLASR